MPRTPATRSPKVALVLNDRAGALINSRGGDETLATAMRDADFAVMPIAPGPLPDRLARARDCGADMIVVGGGDGTIACAAQALAGGHTTLGIIPAGTANLLARDLGIPVGDPAAAIRILQAGETRAIDVGEIDGHAFLCAVMFGSPARLGHHRELGRKRGNGVAAWLHLAAAILRAVHRHRAHNYDLTIDGADHRLRTASLTVTVNALDDHATRMFGRSHLDGGELYIYALEHRSIVALLRLAFNILRGRITSDPSVTVLKGKTLRVGRASRAVRVLVDGEERLLPAPVHITIKPRALTVLAAAGA